MINCIEIRRLDPEEFRKQYKLFGVLKTDDSNVVGDLPVTIYSVSYKKATDFLVLTPAYTTKKDLYDVFPEQHHVISEVELNDLADHDLLTLIFNKQANANLRFNNLSAELNIIYETKKDQRICLVYSVTEESILSCRVNTFSILSEKTLKHFTFKTQKAISQNKLTVYEADETYVYRSSNRTANKKYINRSISKKKNTLDFFSIDSADNKVAEMFRLLRSINNENRSFIELGFKKTEYQRIMEEKRSFLSTYQNLLDKTADGVQINVVDYCDKKEEIKELFEKNGINYSFSCDGNMKDLNIAVIKSKEEYKSLDEEDKHRASDKFILQNIIYKNLNDTVLKQCWLEMLIKKEAITGKVFAVSLSGSWRFYKYINKTIHCLKVEDNQIKDLSSLSVSEDKAKALENYRDLDPRIIENDEKGSILILNTDLRLLPDWNRITESRDEYMVEKNEKTVNKIRKYRNLYFGEAIDINEFMYSDNKYYSVGEIGYGMNKSINNSPATKRVIENGLTIRSIIQMLEPNIYQINKYAVYPYPFKLMDEIFCNERRHNQ
jgi:hypothetical protein